MRIISGKFRGRLLESPKDHETRPTSDRVRESIFNVLENGLQVRWPGLHVLDLYAGTGALGIEALSRGAAFALFVDNHRPALNIIKKNLENFPNSSLFATDATHLAPNTHTPFDVIFLDPPYEKNLIPRTLEHLLHQNYLKDKALIVVELLHKEPITFPKAFHVVKEKKYGKTKILFFQYITADPHSSL